VHKISDIVGQNDALKSLRGAISSANTAHAYLFVGPHGVGKKTTAMAWARALLCLNQGKGETTDACGVCTTCQKINKNNYPDLHIVAPETGKNQTLKQIGVDTTRDLINKLSFKPYVSSRTVAIIKEAEKMTAGAANAFLKTLEEPPGDSVVMLVSENYNALLPTIISRCQTIRFRPAPYETIVQYLTNNHGMEQKQARARAAISRGSLGTAIRETGDELLGLRNQIISMIEKPDKLASIKIHTIAKAMDKSKDKTETDRFLSVFQELLRDLLIIKTTGMYDNLINMDITDQIGEIAERHSERKLLNGFTLAGDLIETRRTWNINPLLVVSLLLQEFNV
tara:strand:- start:27535 stop:28551 length:1017 start_codon:yes stop_codon:yes gene_type:complete